MTPMDCAFSAELDWSGHKVGVSVTFECLGRLRLRTSEVTLLGAYEKMILKSGNASSELQQLLFGRDKNYPWFVQMFALVQKASLVELPAQSPVVDLVLRLKLLTMLMNLLVYRFVRCNRPRL